MTFTAREAKELATITKNHWAAQIWATIYNAVANGLLHCDYYTLVGYDCTQEDIEKMEDIASSFNNYGYETRITVFYPNKFYKNTRIKLHINWE